MLIALIAITESGVAQNRRAFRLSCIIRDIYTAYRLILEGISEWDIGVWSIGRMETACLHTGCWMLNSGVSNRKDASRRIPLVVVVVADFS